MGSCELRQAIWDLVSYDKRYGILRVTTSDMESCEFGQAIWDLASYDKRYGILRATTSNMGSCELRVTTSDKESKSFQHQKQTT